MKTKLRLMSILLCIIMVFSYFTWINPSTSYAWNTESVSISNAVINNGKLTGFDISFTVPAVLPISTSWLILQTVQFKSTTTNNPVHGELTDEGEIQNNYHFTGLSEMMSHSSFKSDYGIIVASPNDDTGFPCFTTEYSSINRTVSGLDIPLNTNGTYYFYLWSRNSNRGYLQFYPDALTATITIKDGKISIQSSSGTNGSVEEIDSCTVSFDSNGGSEIADQQVYKNGTIIEPSNPTKDGYIFEGWKKDGVNFDFNDVITTDINLVANWSLKTYTIDYHLDSNDTNNNTKNSTNVEENYVLQDAEREGYVFDKWVDSNNQPIEPQQLTKENIIALAENGDTINIYPTWTPASDRSYKVIRQLQKIDGEYDDGPENNIIEIKTPATTDEIISLDTPGIREDFVGFEIDEINSSAPTAVKPDNSMEFIVKYKRKEITINYNSDGGSEIEANGEKIKFEDTIAKTDDEVDARTPTKKGYVFIGWMNNDGEIVDLKETTIPDVGTLDLKAKWIGSDSKYTVIKYKENLDGTYTEEIEEIDARTGDEVHYNKKEKGFTIDEDNPNNVLSGVVDSDGELVLKVYYKRDEYRITIDKDDGTEDSIIEQTKKYGDKADKVKEPKKEGYIFDGWETEDGEPFDFDEPIKGDVKIKAKWVLKDSENPKTGDTILYTTMMIVVVMVLNAIITIKRRKNK